MVSSEVDKNLDQIATGGMILYTVNLVKGQSPEEAVYNAIRTTAEIFYTKLLEQINQIEEGL